MKYETPEVSALMPAISAIQGAKEDHVQDGSETNESISAYVDWED